MKITWYGHASFLVETAQGVSIVTDPYDPGFERIAYGPIADSADIVTVSHDHGDHSYVDGVPGNPLVVKGTGRHEMYGIVFQGIPSYHDDTEGSQRGDNTIWTFAVDDMVLCHLGDLGHMLSEKDVANLGSVDILFIPVGGFYTIGPEEASGVVSMVRPGLVIPMHFKTPKCDFPIETVDGFLEYQQDVTHVDGSSISITKTDVTTGSRVVVLQPAL
jgi:L-ascorbate metabolism protein UlaG (beta-lactamase superfamily)